MTIPFNSDNPHLAPMEDVKQGIQSFSMFYYKSLIDAGYSIETAKEQVAGLLEQQYNLFCHQGQIKPKSLGTIQSRLTKVLKAVEEEAKNHPSLRSIHNDLLTIQSQLKR